MTHALIERGMNVLGYNISSFWARKVSDPFKNIVIGRQRRKAEILLSTLRYEGTQRFDGTVVIDAGWDNPNYWLRYVLLRSALGLASGREVGILGAHRRKEQARTLRRLGIDEQFDASAKADEFLTESREAAKELCESLSQPEDVLKWSLPFDMPADFLYDYILKKQRLPFIDVGDPLLHERVTQFLSGAFAANALIRSVEPRLVISSHALSLFFPLVWLALGAGIKVLVPYGEDGLIRFWKVSHTSEIYEFMTSPSWEMFLKLSEKQRCALQEVGRQYLTGRLRGEAQDIGAVYAYAKNNVKIDKQRLCRLFDWEEKKPILAVYASNWFDYPHALGMKHFRDFSDWIAATYDEAKRNKKVNWLFKGHPSDELYGGVGLDDMLVADQYQHINLADKNWQGASVLNAVDGIITYHGSIGVEATAMGKPVMVADKGWYDHWGFVTVPSSRGEFLRLLGTKWWGNMDLARNSKLAQIFAGWYWGRPSWQKSFLMRDDSAQWDIYKTIPDLLEKHSEVISREIDTMGEWFRSSCPHYHVYKMMRVNDYLA